MTGVIENKQNIALMSLFSNCSEDEKSLVEALCFERIDETFFRFVPPETFISTLHYWLNRSVVLNDAFLVNIHVSAPLISYTQLCSLWRDVIDDFVDESHIYIINKRKPSEASISALLSDLFSAPQTELSTVANEISCLVRLLSFFAIRHYFINIHPNLESHQEIEYRIKGLIKFIQAVESKLAKSQVNSSLLTLDNVIEFSKPHFEKDIDRNFFSGFLYDAFGEDIDLAPKSKPVTTPIVRSKEDDDSEVINESDIETLQVTDEADFLPKKSERFLDSLKNLSFSQDDIDVDDDEAAVVYIKLKLKCVVSSLTSRETLEPNFYDYQRKPEYALHLPGLNYALALNEKQAVVGQLLNDLYDDDFSREALVLSMMMLTASSLERLTSFVVTTTFNDRFINSICLKTGVWRRHSLEFEKSFNPAADQLPWLNPHDYFLHLYLPSAIVDALKRQAQKLSIDAIEISNGVPLYRLLGLDEPDLSKSLNAYLNNLKFTLGYGFRQLTQKSMRYALYSEIAHTVDASSASLIFASSEFSNPSTLYYLSLSEKELQTHYAQALSHLGVDTVGAELSRDVFIGSRMCVDIDKLVARIKNKNDTLQTLLDDSNVNVELVIQRHNDFASMVSLAFAFCGALRQLANYFFDYATVCESGGYFFVCEKYHRGESPTRLIPLPALLGSLLDEYRMQLRVTSHALLEHYPDLAKLLLSLYQPRRYGSGRQLHTLTGQPLLGLIVEGQWQSLSSKSIYTFLGDDFTLPGNFTRHFVCSHIPPALFKYRQQLTGHINQGHHVIDEMSVSLSWLNDDGISSSFDSLLKGMGFTSLKAQSLRGAYSLERLPGKAMLYPPGYIERQENSELAYRFAKKNFKALLKQTVSGANIEQAVASLPSNLEVPKSGEHLNQLVEQYYTSWQKTYERAGQASVIAQINALNKSYNNISLQLIEYSSYVEQLQNNFLECIANGRLPLSSKSAFFISLVLYQPCIAMQLIRLGQSAAVSIIQYQSTLLLQASSKNAARVSCPINWLSSYLLMQLETVEQYRIDFKDTTKMLKDWLKEASKVIGLGLPTFLSLEMICRFVSEYGLSTQSRLSVSASKDTVLPGDYSPQDIARLFKHSSGHFYENKNELTPSQSYPVRRRRVLNALKPNSTLRKLVMQNERDFVQKTLKVLREMNDSSKDISVEQVILNQWANYVGATTKTLKHLLGVSNMCTEFLILWLFYGVKASQHPSPVKKGSKIASGTVCNYLTIIADHLQIRVQDDAFLENDEESLEELYFYAVSDSNYENKHEVLRCFKNFHSEVNNTFTIDTPDWGMIEPLVERKVKKRVGIARLLPMADYERAKDYLRNGHGNGSGTSLTQLEIDMHIVTLMLAYRLALRKREIRNLQIRHINVADKIITVRGSQNFATKSVNSPRRIDASLFLNEEEWSSLLRVIENAKKMGIGISSPYLFGSGTLENRRMKIDTIVCNLMDVCRCLTGNHKLRLYDLRHTFINHAVMIIAGFYEDKRYTTSLAQWARCESDSLSEFREMMKIYLIGGQSDVGGIMIYGLARRLGHSPITMRQYYIHILNLLDDVVVNRLLTKQVSQSPLFGLLKQALHDGEGGFRAEQSVRKAIKTLTYPKLIKQPKTPLTAIPEPAFVLDERYKFESFFMRIYQCLVAFWRFRGDEMAQRQALQGAALPDAVWDMFYQKLTETGYRGIFLPTCLGLETDFTPARVDISLRYMNAMHFRTMVDVVTSLYLEQPTLLTNLVSFYLSHQYGDDVIVKEEEIETLKILLYPFDDLVPIFNLTASPFRRRGRNNAFYKLELESKSAERKTTNGKFNFLVMLTMAALAGISFQS